MSQGRINFQQKNTCDHKYKLLKNTKLKFGSLPEVLMCGREIFFLQERYTFSVFCFVFIHKKLSKVFKSSHEQILLLTSRAQQKIAFRRFLLCSNHIICSNLFREELIRTRQGETFGLGFGFALPRLIFRPQGRVWEGMRAGFRFPF